jgi:ubiquinone biosynthesis protein
VEGVARSLDPSINFWEAARPVVEDWARENMGPEARLREVAGNVAEVARRLPAIVRGLEALASTVQADGLRLSDSSLAALADAQRRARRPLLWALWAIAALLGLSLFL